MEYGAQYEGGKRNVADDVSQQSDGRPLSGSPFTYVHGISDTLIFHWNRNIYQDNITY